MSYLKNLRKAYAETATFFLTEVQNLLTKGKVTDVQKGQALKIFEESFRGSCANLAKEVIVVDSGIDDKADSIIIYVELEFSGYKNIKDLRKQAELAIYRNLERITITTKQKVTWAGDIQYQDVMIEISYPKKK